MLCYLLTRSIERLTAVSCTCRMSTSLQAIHARGLLGYEVILGEMIRQVPSFATWYMTAPVPMSRWWAVKPQ